MCVCGFVCLVHVCVMCLCAQYMVVCVCASECVCGLMCVMCICVVYSVFAIWCMCVICVCVMCVCVCMSCLCIGVCYVRVLDTDQPVSRGICQSLPMLHWDYKHTLQCSPSFS